MLRFFPIIDTVVDIKDEDACLFYFYTICIAAYLSSAIEVFSS